MDIKKSILKTLAYFDLFNYPLTKEELLRFLWKTKVGNEKELDEAVKELLSQNSIAQKSGFYFLFGQENNIAQREQSAAQTEKKIRLARRAAKLIRAVPFLQAVFVCNSVGAGSANAQSDIDFFIITAVDRIWIVRFFTNLILRLFRLRTYGNKRADRICLSFYVDYQHLNFAQWRVAEDDIYLAYWLYQLQAIYDPDDYYRRLLASNTWIKDLLPNAVLPISSYLDDKITRPELVWKKIWENLWNKAYGDLLEKQAKALQWQKLKLSLKEAAGKSESAVVIDRGVIKLHENDRRLGYRKDWLDAVARYQ